MSAFGRLTGTFSSLAAATMLFATPACAQEAPDSANHAAVTQVAVASGSAVASPTNYEISDDAHYEADRWVVDHSDRLAIAVRIGGDTQVPLDRIESVLRNDFANNGVTNIRVYFEMAGTSGGSAVSYHTDDYVSAFYPLATARDHVAEAARRLRFDPQLASNMN
jgi:hypothetical protein